MNVEAVFRYVDADEDGALFVHNPTLQMRARARAAVRVWDCGGGDRTKLCLGLSSPRRAGWPPPLASPVSFRRATQTYKAVRRAIQHSHVWTALADQGFSAVTRSSWVRSCLRPWRGTLPAGPDGFRWFVCLIKRTSLALRLCSRFHEPNACVFRITT